MWVQFTEGHSILISTTSVLNNHLYNSLNRSDKQILYNVSICTCIASASTFSKQGVIQSIDVKCKIINGYQ